MDKKHTIFIVDDDAIVVKVLTRILNHAQYDVIACDTPANVLSMLEKSNFDLIISDYHMGEITGFDVFRAVKKLGKKAIKILVTGTPDASLEVKTLSELDVYKVILKPWDNISLIKTIKDALVDQHK